MKSGTCSPDFHGWLPENLAHNWGFLIMEAPKGTLTGG